MEAVMVGTGWMAVVGVAGMASVGWAGPNETAKAAIRSESGWTDMGTQDRDGVTGIQVRHKPMEGVDCLEASVHTALPLETMKAVVLDITGNKRWSSAGLKASTVLSRSGGRIDYVQVLGMPSPFAPRFWFLRGAVQESGETWSFSWEYLDGATTYPEQHASVLAEYADAVEITVNVGSWSFQPAAAGGETLVRFRSCSDAGGSVPRWAGERAARAMLPNNIVDLLKETQRRL